MSGRPAFAATAHGFGVARKERQRGQFTNCLENVFGVAALDGAATVIRETKRKTPFEFAAAVRKPALNSMVEEFTLSTPPPGLVMHVRCTSPATTSGTIRAELRTR